MSMLAEASPPFFARSTARQTSVTMLVLAAGWPPAASTNMVTLVCRAVDLAKNGGDASANIDMAHVVETEIKNCPLVIGAATSLVGNIVADDSNGTVTFQVNVAPTNAPTFTC